MNVEHSVECKLAWGTWVVEEHMPQLTINTTWPDLVSSPDLRGGKRAVNGLFYGTALCRVKYVNIHSVLKQDGSNTVFHYLMHFSLKASLECYVYEIKFELGI
jgi:hypothetical protein